MARKQFMERGNSIIGIYPIDFDRGHVTGHPGKRVTLCTKADLTTMPEVERDRYLIELYYKKERELREQFLDERVQVKAKKKEKKASHFKEASEIWLREVESTLSPKTLKTYRLTTKLYQECNGNHRLNDFDRDYNIQFFTFLTQQKNSRTKELIGPATQNQHMRQLQNFLNWAYDNEYMEKRFQLKKSQVPQKEMETFTQDEVDSLAKYLEEKFNEKNDPRITRQNKNLFRAFMLARHTLVRVGHIWALKLENIDLKKGFVYIKENEELGWKPKGMKWPNKPINKTLMNFLKEDLANRDASERYFLDKGNGKPWHSTSANLSKPMRAACNELGLSKSVKPFHWGIRATYITWLLNEGVPPVQVQHLADHSDLATTMKYFNTRQSSQKNAVDLLG